ncbi:SUKH-4 family immunity protein [Streptomyces sp. LaPpAH-108]|uniref:SUKH-4 family immunity protein n=1 Tax=Streptomyces sp. LaPpAH-108 TaxID=1155714 RepID=UPI000368A2FF|nr:SUKH-4 family immunity protein [Streptomyces sp. LaPpAH-108]
MTPPDFAVSPRDLVEAFGLGHVVRYARQDTAGCRFDGRTGEFLSRVGLPDTEWFMSRADLDHHGPIVLSEWLDRDEEVPGECRDWLVLACFAYSLLALDPATGRVYAFPESDPLDAYIPLHRDVESLVHSLCLFQRFLRDRPEDEDAVARRAERLRARITEFDSLPFEDDESQWSVALEEVVDGIW